MFKKCFRNVWDMTLILLSKGSKIRAPIIRPIPEIAPRCSLLHAPEKIVSQGLWELLEAPLLPLFLLCWDSGWGEHNPHRSKRTGWPKHTTWTKNIKNNCTALHAVVTCCDTLALKLSESIRICVILNDALFILLLLLFIVQWRYCVAQDLDLDLARIWNPKTSCLPPKRRLKSLNLGPSLDLPGLSMFEYQVPLESKSRVAIKIKDIFKSIHQKTKSANDPLKLMPFFKDNKIWFLHTPLFYGLHTVQYYCRVYYVITATMLSHVLHRMHSEGFPQLQFVIREFVPGAATCLFLGDQRGWSLKWDGGEISMSSCESCESCAKW